ncbi:hypothetical protein CDD83_415 [Cordyceps sp. RAO-2017]|nr:hypothetical protein CDD83_415 [Cordyceps sp. RAO-2017]
MDRVWLTVFLSLVLRFASAAPAHAVNETNTSVQKDEPSWESGPHTRGTLGLFFSCVITLFLCVWTTVHVNIEPTNEMNYRFSKLCGFAIPYLSNRDLGKILVKSWVRKLGWGLVTLIVPEGSMAIATYERRTAKLLREKMNEIKKDEKEWDMSLAYYAVMGGFVIPEDVYDDVKVEKEKEKEKNKDERDEKVDIHENKTLTLTPYGVLQVAEWEKGGPPLLCITSEEVRDKGNASSVAKVLVFWQVFWMILQVIGRAVTRLPVTLLELHTVLHTFCAS